MFDHPGISEPVNIAILECRKMQFNTSKKSDWIGN